MAATERMVLDAQGVERALARVTHEILERNKGVANLVFIGVRSLGVEIAERLAAKAATIEGVEVPRGVIDITLYRDDLTTVGPQPVLKGTDIPTSIDGRTVVLVDDVLFTGRTVRAALDELIDFGRPARIELAVLVDRGHRELPIHADYAGKTLTTTREEVVQVRLKEEDGDDRVVLLERGAPSRPRTPARKRRPRR